MTNDEGAEPLVAGRFRLGRMLGAGGMGTVHEAIDVTLDRPVALKLLRDGLAGDPHQIARFEREARAAARLAHPNVVGVTELVRDERMGLVLVMELLHGESLATRLERSPLGEAEAVHVFMQALDGLSAAHDAGMIHRDLKPSNLFLVPIAGGSLVKILDFGIVKLAEEGALPKLTRKGAMIGTPTYMSPEQVSCEPVDARSDVYSMGACLYEALVARPPYVGAHSLEIIAAVGAGPPPEVREIDRAVSPDLAHVVKVAMARDPSGRYRSAAAMREALRGAVVSSRTPKKPAERETHAPARRAMTDDTASREASPRSPAPNDDGTTVPPHDGAGSPNERRRASVGRAPLWAVMLAAAATSTAVAGWWWSRSDRASAPARAGEIMRRDEPSVAPPAASPLVPPPVPSVPTLPRGIDPPPEADRPPPAERPRARRPSIPDARPAEGSSEPAPPPTGIGEVVIDPFAPR